MSNLSKSIQQSTKFVGREEIRAPLKTPAWEAKQTVTCVRFDFGSEIFLALIAFLMVGNVSVIY